MAKRKSVRKVTLTQLTHAIKAADREAKAAGNPRGACLVKDPTGVGGQMCVVVDRDLCTKVLKGTFIGGPC
jgi:hypothetical protein